MAGSLRGLRPWDKGERAKVKGAGKDLQEESSASRDIKRPPYQGAGLRIWASRSAPNIVTDPPLFEGRATIAMARQVYGIRNSAGRQLPLF